MFIGTLHSFLNRSIISSWSAVTKASEWGVPDVTVIVVGSRIGDNSSNPEPGSLRLTKN